MTKQTSLTEIESSARRLSDSRFILAELVDSLNQELEATKRKALPSIKRAVARAAAYHSELTALIDGGRDLFVKPRTVVFHGIKCGLKKGEGKITISDPDNTVARIEKQYGEYSDLLNIKKTPNKETLASLPVAELKAIGCTVEDTGDQILIKFTDSAVDKAVNALLKDAISEATEQAA